MRFDFKTLLIYSPRGSSQNAVKSKQLLGLCKNGNLKFCEAVAKRIKDLNLQDYFNGATLIPIPRSSPIIEGSLFPSKVIAEALLSNNIGNNVSLCLKRTKAIPRSSSQYDANNRNSVQTHLESLAVDSELILDPVLILIDDVFTQGRTAMGCAIKLKEVFPEKEIKVFCPFRTRSFEDNDICMSSNQFRHFGLNL